MPALSPSARPVERVILLSDTVWDAHGDAIRRIVPDVRPVVYVGDEPIPDAILEDVEVAFLSSDVWPDRIRGISVSVLKAPNLRWMQTFSAGVDSPFFAQLRGKGVRLTTASGATASPIAQTVVLYMLALSRDMRSWMRKQDAREWKQHPIEELDGSRLAVVGMGPIGEEIARLGLALGMDVIGVRRTPTGHEPCPIVTFDELPNVLRRSDWVAVALPLTPGTLGMFGDAEFAAMRPGARFINVGRGELVDEPALVRALHTGHLAGAGLDVFATEPLPVDSPLWAMDNVIITPHNSGTSQRSLGRVVEIFLDNLERYLNGRDLRNEVSG